MSKELEVMSDADLASLVEEIVTQEELTKSMPQEESEEEKKKKAAAAQSEAAPAAEVEKSSSGNVSTPADGGQPVDGPGPGASVDATKDKKKSDKDLGAVDGVLPEAGGGATGGSEEVANPKSEGGFIAKSEVEKILSTMETLVKSVQSAHAKIAELEEKTAEEMKKSQSAVASADEFRKSITVEITERLAKSYAKETEELRKANAAVITEVESLRKSNDTFPKSNEALKAESEELRKSLKKPADTRASIRNVDAIEKSVEQQAERTYKSKAEVCSALEELRKSGKVSGDEVISYNVSNILSENAKRHLKSHK